MLSIELQKLTGQELPFLTAIESWPPLAIQNEIWADGGVALPDLGTDHPALSFLGRAEDDPAGSVWVRAQGPSAQIDGLFVLPHYRRQGLGRNLVIACARWAQAQGCTQIRLAAPDETARAFAAALGFTQEETQ